MVRRIAVPLIAAAGLGLVVPVAAQAATKSVDMGLPPKYGKPFQQFAADVNAFFPNGISIHVGDSVSFNAVGFHTVELPVRGRAPQLFVAPAGGPIAGVNDAAGAPFWFNGRPTLGLNPGGNGLGKRLTYSGAKRVASGLAMSDRPKPMTVKFTKAGAFAFYCTVHPGMKGTVRVKRRGTKVPSAAADARRVAAQAKRALAVAKGLKSKAKPRANTVDVGLEGAGGVAYYGFAPESLTVPVGTVVNFAFKPGGREFHTATTGPGDPEKEPKSYLGAMTAAIGGPPSAVAQPAIYQSDPSPVPAALTPSLHGNGFWNSGFLDGSSTTPAFGTSRSVRLAAAGTYRFVCLIHPFMRGSVTAR